MIYLLGANGDIGINISSNFKKKDVEFISVTRKPSKDNIGFNDFLKEISNKKDVLVINSAKLSLEDLNLFTISAPSCTRVVHISSVAVYGNSNFSNIVSPINSYGNFKVMEEKKLNQFFSTFIIRLSNIYGGNPETSGAMKLYNSNKLNYIEVDEKNNELIRDYIEIEKFINVVYKNLDFVNTKIINVSSGFGITLTDFFYLNNINISNIKRKLFDRKTVIEKSIIDNNFVSNKI